MKSGRDTGVGDTGTGHLDFANHVALVQFLQDETNKGRTIAVLAIRVLG